MRTVIKVRRGTVQRARIIPYLYWLLTWNPLSLLFLGAYRVRRGSALGFLLLALGLIECYLHREENQRPVIWDDEVESIR